MYVIYIDMNNSVPRIEPVALWNGMSGHMLTEGGTECLSGDDVHLLIWSDGSTELSGISPPGPQSSRCSPFMCHHTAIRGTGHHHCRTETVQWAVTCGCLL